MTLDGPSLPDSARSHFQRSIEQFFDASQSWEGAVELDAEPEEQEATQWHPQRTTAQKMES